VGPPVVRQGGGEAAQKLDVGCDVWEEGVARQASELAARSSGFDGQQGSILPVL
jgi:hypothetical protein